jgi:hypothetical protein
MDKNKFLKQRVVESASVSKKNTIGLGKGRRDYKESKFRIKFKFHK